MADGSEVVEVVGASVANKTTVAGAVTGLFGWMAQVDWIGLSGFLLAMAGFLVSVYFQWRRDRREAAAHAAYVASLTDTKKKDDASANKDRLKKDAWPDCEVAAQESDHE